MFEKYHERIQRAIAGFLGSYGAGEYSSYRAAMYIVENYPDLSANIIEVAIREMATSNQLEGNAYE